MSCSNCQKTKALPYCLATLQIGTITGDTSVVVILRNLATGYNHFFEAASAANGALSIDLTGESFSSNQQYELTVWQTNLADTLPVTVEGVPYTCFIVWFKYTFSGNGSLTVATAPLTIEE